MLFRGSNIAKPNLARHMRLGFSTALLAACLLAFFPWQALKAADTYYEKYETRGYTFSHFVTVTNEINWPITDLEIIVPLMDFEMPEYQELLWEYLTPYPQEIRVNEDGRREAVYLLPWLAPGEEIVLEQRYALNTSAIHYLLAQFYCQPYTGGIDERFLLPEPGIESDDLAIRQFASLFAGEENIYLLARSVFSSVNMMLSPGLTPAAGDTYSALQAYLGKKGTCQDYGALFVAVMRALGVPARMQTGYLYEPNKHNAEPYTDPDSGCIDLFYLPHTWAEFYLPGVGWVPVDAAFENFEVSIDGSLKKVPTAGRFAAILPSQRYIFFCGGAEINDIRYSEYFATLSVSARMVEGTESIPFTESVPFSDVTGHWAKDEIMFLYNYNGNSESPLLRGVGDGLFGVEQLATRAEVAVLLARTFGGGAALPGGFEDVPWHHWAYEEICQAGALGWMIGYGNGEFHPDEPVTRAEMAMILTRVFELALPADYYWHSPFDDLDSHWAREAAMTINAYGLDVGAEPGVFAPEGTVTRAEMAVFLCRAMRYNP
ncbi:MAG: S-layer homology domain-containing protein [Clostridiales bacterium]|nr:S-layer homology domain-containing protein [Clostridiales bacterium]